MAPIGTRRVLIVDDDEQIALVMAALLRLQCDEVVVAGTLGGAFGIVRSRAFAVVLLDLILPDSTAERTIEAIPMLIRQGAPRVICITGGDFGIGVRAAAVGNGAQAVWSKDAELPGRIARLFEVPPPP